MLKYLSNYLTLAGRFFKPKKAFWRINQNIRSRELRVIDADGKQIGVLSVQEALKKAAEAELDLVEIAPAAKPPVAKIIDFAKFRYQQEKKEKESRRKEKKGSEQKEVWLTPFMGESDYNVRLERVKEFLGEGNKVRIVVRFTGPQMSHREFGYQMAEKVKSDTQDIAGIDQAPKFLGRQLMMVLTPVKQKVTPEVSS
ncbi:MAG: translation initiation factor IF-3 [Candidatus Blackburnbacteria bacterium]|nr:translation initiation factor IF-3 [Candidatus Blackburnbacteria bacterium]